jgi:hypothetical protein
LGPTTIAEQVSAIAEQVKAMRSVMAAQPPNEAMSAFAREQVALAAQGTPDSVAAIGSMLPDADLVDTHGASTTTYQTQLLPALVERDVTVLALSPQIPDESLSMQQKNDLAFPAVSDPGREVAAPSLRPHQRQCADSRWPSGSKRL